MALGNAKCRVSGCGSARWTANRANSTRQNEEEEFRAYREDLPLSGIWPDLTRDIARGLSNSFPAFRCIGMLPRIY